MNQENINKFVRCSTSSSICIDTMKKMLKDESIKDINVVCTDFYNSTALIYQSTHGTKEVMEWLLTREPSANPNLKDQFGFTNFTNLRSSEL